MKRRIQIRRNASDPVALAIEEGRKQGRAEQKKEEDSIVGAAVARARGDAREAHDKEVQAMQQEQNRLHMQIVEMRNEIEMLERNGGQRDVVQEKIRKRLQSDDTRDWIAQFGDAEDAPFVEDEGEYGRSPASPARGRHRVRR